MTETATEPASTNDTWTQQLAGLKAHYKHVREPVLVALNILLHDEDIELADAKAQAALHGVRITAASVNAARTLLSRMESQPAPTTADSKRPPRRPRTDKTGDAEALIRGFVAKLQGQGNVEAERLRDAMRKANAVLQAALDGR